MTIMSQTIMVDNETRRPFSSDTFDSGHTAESAAKRQRFRRSIGGEFINGWYVVRRKWWTEYQRYYEEA